MIRRYFVIFLLLIASCLFGDYEDYDIFSRGQEYFNNKDYLSAEGEFDKLTDNYKESSLFKSNYANYYIGLNYFYLEEYQKSIEFLEKAKYKPLELQEGGYFKSKKEYVHQYEIEFYIATAYEQQGNREKAVSYYKLLQKHFFDPDLEGFRQKALSKLIEYNEYYKYIEEVLYEKTNKNISKIKLDDLVYIGNYLFSKGKLEKAEFIYKIYLLKSSEPNYTVERKLLESLFRQKKHSEVIRLSKGFLEAEKKDLYTFYLGNSLRRSGEYQEAISTLSGIGNNSVYYSESNYILARLYLVYKNYDKAIESLKESNSWSAPDLMAEVLLQTGEDKGDYSGLKEFLKKNNWMDISGKYRYKLYEIEKDPQYLEDIIKYNTNTYYYELALNILGQKEEEVSYPIESLNEKYQPLTDLLLYLKSFKDKNLAKIAINQYDFGEDKLFKTYLRINNFKDSNDFHNALNLALRNQGTFYRYTNLRHFLYPEYYKEYVKKYSVLYGVDQALAYSIIRQESQFNKDVISTASACGLMQMVISTALDFNKELTPADLLLPENSIRYGIQYIKTLLNRYQGSISTTVAAYNGGPGNLKKWTRDENGDIVIDSITFTETQKYVERVMNNYYKYKRIYKEETE